MKKRIGFLLKPEQRDHARPIFYESFDILKNRGVDVELIVPEEHLITLPDIRVTCTLYVLRPGVELALSLAGILHDKGANIVNCFSACSIVHDKCRVTARLLDCGIPTPHSYVTGFPEQVLDVDRDFRFVIKPSRGSAGEGVEFVPREEMVNEKHDGPVFIQEYLQSLYGQDLKVYVIGDEVFGLRRPYPARTFEEKTGQVVDVDPQIRAMALKIGKLFNLEVYGVDFIETENGPYVIDVNYFPGMIGVPEVAERIADYLYCKATGSCCYLPDHCSHG